MAAAHHATFMADRLPIGAVPGVPEIRLHQAGPHSGLRRWAERAGATGPPYWAHPWGGGLVLARFLLDRPGQVAGRRVLDLGSGSGLVAIAAALAGAARVTAIDVDPHAVAATAINAALNGVKVTALQSDLPADPIAVDTVLVGDLFYTPGLARRVSACLKRFVATGQAVLVGDPGRASLPRDQLEPLFCRSLPDFGTGEASAPATVYRFIG